MRLAKWPAKHPALSLALAGLIVLFGMRVAGPELHHVDGGSCDDEAPAGAWLVARDPQLGHPNPSYDAEQDTTTLSLGCSHESWHSRVVVQGDHRSVDQFSWLLRPVSGANPAQDNETTLAGVYAVTPKAVMVGPEAVAIAMLAAAITWTRVPHDQRQGFLLVGAGLGGTAGGAWLASAGFFGFLLLGPMVLVTAVLGLLGSVFKGSRARLAIWVVLTGFLAAGAAFFLWIGWFPTYPEA